MNNNLLELSVHLRNSPTMNWSRLIFRGVTLLLLPSALACADLKKKEMEDAGDDPPVMMDAGPPDAEVPAAKLLPTMVVPVSGGGQMTSGKHKASVTVTAPQLGGEASSAKHKATLSVTGENQ